VSAAAQPLALRVRAIAWTHFAAPDDVDWATDAEGGQALAEFAGRACYASWDKPNPATATNAGYLRHILEVGHLAVLEHASATFSPTGVSRSLAHQLVRHRHLSFSQLSQRHVPHGPVPVVEPDVIAADPQLHARFVAATQTAGAAYAELLAELEQRADAADGAEASLRRKQARQAAQAVLPAAAETRLVVTGNYRTWRHFVGMRASEHADVEMRALAVTVLRELQRIAPNAFADFTVTALPDGTAVAASPLVADA
jgi:thymidylate synthase (FAD)